MENKISVVQGNPDNHTGNRCSDQFTPNESKNPLVLAGDSLPSY